MAGNADRSMLRVVDSHVHAWPSGASSGAASSGPTWDDAAAALSLGRRVHRVALVTPGQPPGDDAWSLDTAAASGGAVRAVVRHAALGLLDQHAGAAHAAGVRIVVPEGAASSFDGVVEEAARRRLGVCVQNPARQWEAVADWAARHRDQAFLIDHLGHPDVATGVATPAWQSFLALAAHPNIAVKMPNLVFFAGSLDAGERLAPHVSSVLESFGPQRLLWASDWPNTGPPPYHDVLDAALDLVAGIDADIVESVFQRNAERLLWGSDGA